MKAFAVFVLGALAWNQACATTNLNLAYASVSAAQKLDLYVPTTTNGPLPLIIRIHGGAFSGGDKSSEASSVAALQARGYAVASLNYRLSGEALFPAGAQDVKAAVRWLRANAATYGLDPNRFATWGWSAGAYLGPLLAVTGDQATLFDDFSLGHSNVSSAVQAVVSWCGLVNFGSMDNQFRANPPASCPTTWLPADPANSPASVWLGGALPTIPATVAQANLTNYMVTAGALPPFRISHGDNDCIVPWGQSAEMHRALTNRGASSQLVIKPGWSHVDPRFDSADTTPALDFLDLYLKPPPLLTLRTNGGQLEISWPASATGYDLQWTSNLVAANEWTPATNSPSSVNGISRVVLTLDSAQRFYRLAKAMPGASTDIHLQAFETECATVGANWQIGTDTNASNGKYATITPGLNSAASAPTGAGDWVVIPFSVTNGATYNVFARGYFPDANGDSFWAKMDAGSFTMYNSLSPYTAWSWVSLGSYSLAVGAHTLTIGYREDGARLDKLVVTDDASAPTGLGPVAALLCP